MPRFLETLARVQADSPRPLAETLASDRAAGGGARLWSSLRRMLKTRAWRPFWRSGRRGGGQHFGLALDAASFRAGTRPAGLAGSAGSAAAGAGRAARR